MSTFDFIQLWRKKENECIEIVGTNWMRYIIHYVTRYENKECVGEKREHAKGNLQINDSNKIRHDKILECVRF